MIFASYILSKSYMPDLWSFTTCLSETELCHTEEFVNNICKPQTHIGCCCRTLCKENWVDSQILLTSVQRSGESVFWNEEKRHVIASVPQMQTYLCQKAGQSLCLDLCPYSNDINGRVWLKTFQPWLHHALDSLNLCVRIVFRPRSNESEFYISFLEASSIV